MVRLYLHLLNQGHLLSFHRTVIESKTHKMVTKYLGLKDVIYVQAHVLRPPEKSVHQIVPCIVDIILLYLTYKTI